MTAKLPKKTAPRRKPQTLPAAPFLDLLTVPAGRRQRRLTDEERQTLILMLAQKRDEAAFDLDRLAPEGSFLKSLTRHFGDTDISYALPLFQLVMVAASWLTQHGAHLDIAGTGPIRPTLWTIGLAESGSSKTFAADRVWKILSSEDGLPPANRIGMVSSDAQWIIDLAENNGALWFQDEVGKFVHAMNTSSQLARMKAWMLEAYSNTAIGNRLKGEEKKLVIEDPHFTFHGMTVLSTWSHDVNATSMMDGWCQRMNYYVAPARTDTGLFDHFLYFEGADVPLREAALRETWQALCAQPGAGGRYSLAPEALAYIRGWWKSLQASWGDFALPASFLRRIGFSVLRYTIVLQFLLGKSRHPIDVETAALATAFGAYHMESALYLVQSYDQTAGAHVRRILDLRTALAAEGKAPSVRNISRRLSKAARAAASGPLVGEILKVVGQVTLPQDDFPAFLTGEDKKGSAAGRC